MQSRLQLKEIRSSRTCRGYHCTRELLSIMEIDRLLRSHNDGIKAAGKTMKENIENVGDDLFLRLPIDFPITKLQHVTNLKSAEKILTSRSFKARGNHERPEFRDLSFWSADISSYDIDRGRLEAYHKVQHLRDAERFQEEIKEQFANSPAFVESASRYGNFRFSFSMSHLLNLYMMQHCGGEEPQLRILGTDVYKQEIAHYIVVHSPDTEQFQDLPIVPSDQTSHGQHPFVIWMAGQLSWRPESTSRSLKLKISQEGCKVRQSQGHRSAKSQRWRKKRALEPRCIWNELVFAFHLPNNGQLNLSMADLLHDLNPCGCLQPFLGEEPMQEHEAKEKIRKFRNRF